MNRKLILQGSAGEALGEEWSVNAPTVGDAFAIIRANKPKEFMEYFSRNESQGEFSVKLAGEALEEAELALHNLGEGDIVVTPMPQGSKLNGVEKIIVAAILIIASWYMGDPTIAADAAGAMSKGMKFLQSATQMLGVNMAMSGITQLLMKEPSTDSEEEGAMFGGPANTVKHGLPVPVAYGKVLVGGTTINFGFGAWKLEPTNGFVFSSDNPKAWDGKAYITADSGTRNGRGNSEGGENESDTDYSQKDEK